MEFELDFMREILIEKIKKNLRLGQQIMGEWQGGEMAISAVPGAGKSHSLAIGAAVAIANYNLTAKKQLLIVTYTRSAAVSIKNKIKEKLDRDLEGILGAQAHNGFMVHTLHGLALHIATRHRELSGINLDNATVIVPTPSNKIIRDTVEKWIINNELTYEKLIQGEKNNDEQTENLRRQFVLRTGELPNLAYTIIKEAKSSGLSPENIKKLSYLNEDKYNILEIGAGLYQEYEKLMKARNYLDYEDMILAALRVLENSEILQLWRNQIFAVFEDEAQDSTPLQGKLIHLLASNSEDNSVINLVRVGDPNQAINSTFTPADSIYFNSFCDSCKIKNHLSTMDRAGRSNIIIMEAANFLVEWANQEKFTFRPQFIKAVAEDDPQVNANPQAEEKGLEIYTPFDIFETVKLIGKKVKELLSENPERNAAILVRENSQSKFLAKNLQYLQEENGIKIFEVGEAERKAKIPEEMLKLLKFIDRPHSSDYLKSALEVLQERQLIRIKDLDKLIIYPEDFLYPSPLITIQNSTKKEGRLHCCKILQVRLELPPYDLIPFLGIMLGYEGSELATMQKLSERINQQNIGQNSLKNIIQVLDEIVSSERFDGVDEENQNQYTKPNQLTIITMHKSKGLDWDYVFIPFLHKNVLPGELFVSQNKDFLGDFTLSEVGRSQIRTAIHSQYLNAETINKLPSYQEAWETAKKLKKAEEYRLLYVAMTRAKRLLWMSAAQNAPFKWSWFNWEQENSLKTQEPCPFLPALKKKFTDF